MLVHQHGSLQNCPRKIKGRILEKEGAIMAEELRNKLRSESILISTLRFMAHGFETLDVLNWANVNEFFYGSI